MSYISGILFFKTQSAYRVQRSACSFPRAAFRVQRIVYRTFNSRNKNRSTCMTTEKYDKLRKMYRDLVQLLMSRHDAASAEHIHRTYRGRNVRSSIDTELRAYIDDVSLDIKNAKIHDSESCAVHYAHTYWSAYAFKDLQYDEKVWRMTAYFEAVAADYFAETSRTTAPVSAPTEIHAGDVVEATPTKDGEWEDVPDTADGRDTADPNDNVFPEFIVELAKDLSREIEIPAEISQSEDPKDILQKMMSEDGMRMVSDMMQKVSAKLQHKVKSGELDPNQIRAQAQSCLRKMAKQNPQMKDMVDAILSGKGPVDVGKMFGDQFGGDAAGLQRAFESAVGGKSGASRNTHSASSARARLQAKLRARQAAAGQSA